jgi:hypothetical protein
VVDEHDRGELVVGWHPDADDHVVAVAEHVDHLDGAGDRGVAQAAQPGRQPVAAGGDHVAQVRLEQRVGGQLGDDGEGGRGLGPHGAAEGLDEIVNAGSGRLVTSERVGVARVDQRHHRAHQLQQGERARGVQRSPYGGHQLGVARSAGGGAEGLEPRRHPPRPGALGRDAPALPAVAALPRHAAPRYDMSRAVPDMSSTTAGVAPDHVVVAAGDRRDHGCRRPFRGGHRPPNG